MLSLQILNGINLRMGRLLSDEFRKIRSFGGERGIRTPGTPKGTTDFESAPFNRSGISPRTHKDKGQEHGRQQTAMASVRRFQTTGWVEESSGILPRIIRSKAPNVSLGVATSVVFPAVVLSS